MKVIQVSWIAVQIRNVIFVDPMHLWRSAVIQNVVIAEMRMKLKQRRPVRGVESVITIAHHVIRSGMVVDHRGGKTMYRLCMSMWGTVPIKGKKRLVVVHIVEYLLAFFFKVMFLIVCCFVCLLLWRVFLSRDSCVTWR